MQRRAVVLVALLVVTVPAGALGPSPVADGVDAADAADAPYGRTAALQDATLPGTVDRLTIPDDRLGRTGSVRVGLDLGGALSVGTDGLRARYDALAAREWYHTANTSAGRVALLADRLDAVAADAARLRRVEREAVRAYVAGDRTTRELVGDLARVHARSTGLRDVVDTLGTLAAGVPNTSLIARAGSVDARLATLRGPVRDRVVDAVAGRAEPVRVHVEASDAGLVIGYLAAEAYVREASRADRRDDALGDPALNFGVASEYAVDSYPWAFNNSQSTGIDVLDADTFRLTVEHLHGTLTAYVDGSTGRVYREVQRQRLARLPTEGIATVRRGGVRLSVERTYPGGPMRVSLTNGTNASAVPDGVVILGNASVGTTSTDGELWLVEPRRPYTVTAVRGATMLSVSVDPTLATPAGPRLRR